MQEGLGRFCLVAAQGRSEDKALYQAYNFLEEKKKLGLTWEADNMAFESPELQRNYVSSDRRVLEVRNTFNEVLQKLYPGGPSDYPEGYQARDIVLDYLAQESNKSFLQDVSGLAMEKVNVSSSVKVLTSLVADRTCCHY